MNQINTILKEGISKDFVACFQYCLLLSGYCAKPAKFFI